MITTISRSVLPLLGVLMTLLLPSAVTAAPSGGAEAFSEPEIERIDCVTPKSESCAQGVLPAGARVRLVGRDLRGVRRVVFRGADGRRDDAAARVSHVGAGHADVQVPGTAQTGPVDLVVRGGDPVRAMPRVTVRPLVPAGQIDGHVFPIQGKHDVGQTETNNFGGGRNHQGQDMFAACGTPLVAAQGGRVRMARANHPRAGNYLVITGESSGLDYVYMHMQAPPAVETGDVVVTGQRLGEVGDSGNANGCHVHFEIWSAPGWYTGGKPIDPLPLVRAWDPDH